MSNSGEKQRLEKKEFASSTSQDCATSNSFSFKNLLVAVEKKALMENALGQSGHVISSSNSFSFKDLLVAVEKKALMENALAENGHDGRIPNTLTAEISSVQSPHFLDLNSWPKTPAEKTEHIKRKGINKLADTDEESTEIHRSSQTRSSCRKSLNFISPYEATDDTQNGKQVFKNLIASRPTQRIEGKKSIGPAKKTKTIAWLLENTKRWPCRPAKWIERKRSGGPTRHKRVARLMKNSIQWPNSPGIADDARSTMGTRKRSKRSMLINSTCDQGPPLALTWKSMSPIDSITEKHNWVDQNAESGASVEKHDAFHSNQYKEHSAIFPFQNFGAVVSFDASLQLRTRKSLPNVHLDAEKTRVWRPMIENIDGTNEENTEWWEEERRALTGRAESFIARMHLVQGDMSFSTWKGSVVDSIVGVFLTQNVSDHLSSSAFMSLITRFPLKPSIYSAELNGERSSGTANEPEINAVNSDGTFVSTCSLQSEDRLDNPLDPKSKGERFTKKKTNQVHWDQLRKQIHGGRKRKRTDNTLDSADWDAVRCADVHEIAQTIKERGMNNMLAKRIKDFLNRLVRDHGSIDLEWLRDVPPNEAKDYLLSIEGLGLKSVDCVRLLTLHHSAFPVDTNVGRVAVRLGWVPLQPLPESIQLHLLQLYPVLKSIHKYLWPRLCKLHKRTLYELHYHMITFGKVFCTKIKPNCNACPMRGDCRHYASACASARLALPAPQDKSIVSATENRKADQNPIRRMDTLQLPSPQVEEMDPQPRVSNSSPIIEEPQTPEPVIEVPAISEPDYMEAQECDIESTFGEDSDEIPTVQLNVEDFTHDLKTIIKQSAAVQEGEMLKALVALTSEAASVPVPKLKNVSRLRTEHLVYELPDSHPLLEGMDKPEHDALSPYLLAIWTPGETMDSIEPPEKRCSFQELDKLCTDETCSSCNMIRESNFGTVRGTLLIPCRTAMRGSFPLNGTYFQVNEVFADHDSSLSPIDVPRKYLWNLPRRIVYFGTSVSTIFKGMTIEGIQYCFWRGFVCVRGFDRKMRTPRPLVARLHFPTSKLMKGKRKKNEI